MMTNWNWGCLLLFVATTAVVWVSILFVVGGTDALGFFVRVFLVLSAFSVLGAGVGWISRKIGGSIDE